MRKTLLLAALALPLAACATGYGADPLSQILGSIGTLGSAGYGNTGYGTYGYPAGYSYGYGGGFSQAAASACANYASRYGRVSVRNVQQLDASHVKVFGYVSNGYRNEGWDCTFRADGRVTDFDL
jgi:hypothetical protein